MMREEFLKSLMEELNDIPETDRVQMKEFYDEMIADAEENGQSVEETLNKLGTPADVARKLREEYGQVMRCQNQEQNEEEQKHSQEKNISTDQVFEPERDVQMIRVDARNVSVRIVSVPSGKVRIKYNPDTNIENFTCVEQNGEFVVTQRYLRTTWGIWGFWIGGLGMHGFHMKEILIEMPMGARCSLDVTTSNARITANGELTIGNCQFTTSNARIIADHVDAGSMILRTTNGSVQAGRIQAESLEASTSNGKIELSNVEAGRLLQAVSSNGRVEIMQVGADEIYAKTSNGSINGLLKGKMQDYSIESRTSNGSNNLPMHMELAGAPKLTAYTSNGKINIRFLG